MNELISVNYENDNPTVLGRNLHETLEIKTAYKDWFPRMCEYGFSENIDYLAIAQKRATAQGNETTYTDHQLTIDMAKQICMIQRTDKGRQCREYFLNVEKQWNIPEAVMARALRMADKRISELTHTNTELQAKLQEQKLLTAPTPERLYTTTEIAQSYGMTVKRFNLLLGVKGLLYCENKRWHLYYKHKDRGLTTKKKTWLRWTAKGLRTIQELLKADGIFPEIVGYGDETSKT